MSSDRDRDVVLISCSRQKREQACAAGDLYISDRFLKARKHAQATGRQWYVLSAKWGLLHPDDIIAPYDMDLTEQSSSYRTAWAEWVAARLEQAEGSLRGRTVQIHASEAYSQPLLEPAIRGGTVCRYHGGSTAHIKRKAKERLDRDQDLATMRAIVRRTLGDLAIPAGKAHNAFAARLEALPPPAQRVCEANIDAGQDKPTPEPPQDNVIEEYRARQLLPADELPALPAPEVEALDAEVAPEPEPYAYRPSAAIEAAERPGRPDAPADESAASTARRVAPPVSVTYEEAAAVMRANRETARRVRVRRVRW